MSGAGEASSRSQGEIVTAGLLVIGDEILSGRTKDKNIGFIAEYLTAIGIDLKEVRVVPDEEPEIVAALNALRTRYTYIFTTGGIGPTHDDITADAVAKAFGVAIDYDPRAVEILRELLALTARRDGESQSRCDDRLLSFHGRESRRQRPRRHAVARSAAARGGQGSGGGD